MTTYKFQQNILRMFREITMSLALMFAISAAIPLCGVPMSSFTLNLINNQRKTDGSYQKLYENHINTLALLGTLNKGDEFSM